MAITKERARRLMVGDAEVEGGVGTMVEGAVEAAIAERGTGAARSQPTIGRRVGWQSAAIDASVICCRC
jgi:hypothetical protein